MLSQDTGTADAAVMGEVEVPPALIVDRFGPPRAGDGSKVSGEYVFVDAAGEPFVVHDWKSTNLWDRDFPSPAEFWAAQESQELSISARDLDTSAFERWFLEQLGVGPTGLGTTAGPLGMIASRDLIRVARKSCAETRAIEAKAA